MSEGQDWGEILDLLWLVGVIGALGLLFAAGLRLPPLARGWGRWAGRALMAGAALLLVVAANVALYRNDAHFDLTRERAFTPSPEALNVIRSLQTDVELVYFYQSQNPAGRGAKSMVEMMGRLNPRLHVRTVDPDQNPGLANSYGVRLYNVALIQSEGRRLEVATTEDSEIALGILRVVRSQAKTICFVADHGGYDIDNFEFHTHFEGSHGHSHDAQGLALVQMEQHGLGRLRRALEKLGLSARKITLASLGQVPDDCAVLVEVNPRSQMTPQAVGALRAYLGRGGALMLLIEPDYPVDPSLAALLAQAGIGIDDGIMIDPSDHYFTDLQMVAVAKYARHPVSQQLSLSFFPGIRPLRLVPAERVQAVALFSSSASSYAVSDRTQAEAQGKTAARGARPLAIVSEGMLPGAAKPFRVLVVGDADFASNSFFPYLSNADLTLGGIAWLMREEKAPTMKPPVEVLPTVTLTGDQVYWIFLVTVLALPGLIVLSGMVVWWRRRR